MVQLLLHVDQEKFHPTTLITLEGKCTEELPINLTISSIFPIKAFKRGRSSLNSSG